MGVQIRQDNTNAQLIKSGNSFVISADIAQNAGRVTPLLKWTVMAFDVIFDVWVPFRDALGVDTQGGGVPRGVYMGADIPAADLVDGDIEGASILIGGNCTVDENRLVWDDNICNPNNIINPGTVETRTARAALANVGIWLEDTVDISEFEN
jgi:hypothetical protein